METWEHVAAPGLLAADAISCPRLDRLRRAIRHGEVSFPGSVPSFAREHCGQMQWRAASLYFVRGWTPDQLAVRYNVTSRRIRQLLREWVECAVALGYLQEIPVAYPQCFLAVDNSNPKTTPAMNAIAM